EVLLLAKEVGLVDGQFFRELVQLGIPGTGKMSRVCLDAGETTLPHPLMQHPPHPLVEQFGRAKPDPLEHLFADLPYNLIRHENGFLSDWGGNERNGGGTPGQWSLTSSPRTS